MSGFSENWLAMREPVDHRSVDAVLRARLIEKLAGRDVVAITDIGCGTGSHLRALAPRLGSRQRWTLVDHDAALLAAARETLSRWAADVHENDGCLALMHSGRSIEVRFLQADLSGELDLVLGRDADAVTAAAFFDLVSPQWIARFAAGVAARKLPLYAVLTYCGSETWSPPHEADSVVLQAFHVHQQTDKGFGQAAGPSAVDALGRSFAAHGYDIATGDSPWRLTQADGPLIAALAEGSAAAVAETGMIEAQRLASWRSRRAAAKCCVIGHRDFLAWPREF